MSFFVSPQELAVYHTETGLDVFKESGGLPALCEKLKVDLEAGVSANDVLDRRQAFGENRILEKPPKSYFSYLWDALGDTTIRLLCACAFISITVSLIFEEGEDMPWIEGVAILLTVVGVCNIQAVQDWSKERSFRKLNADVNHVLVTCTRDGMAIEVTRYELVVGDVVLVGVGDILEADGILIWGEDVECDESALTGEPEDIKKDIDDVPFLFSGSAVKNGSGRYIVTAVGVHSVNGKITALVRGQKLAAVGGDVGQSPKEIDEPKDPSKEGDEDEEGAEGAEDGQMEYEEYDEEEDEDSDSDDDDEEEQGSVLRMKLDAMVGKIARFAFISAGFATNVMLVRFCYEEFLEKMRSWRWDHDPDIILEAVITGIAIVVVAVPEGLPLAVTLALSLSMRKMQTDNCLVKHLDATETMGSATTICSDKTGTLTQNRMTVVRAYTGGQTFAGEHSKDRTCGKILGSSKQVSNKLQDLMCENLCLTTTEGTHIRWDHEADRWEQTGNKTDCALLAFADDLEYKYKEIRQKPEFLVKDKKGGSPLGLKMYPFSSARKRCALAVPTTSNPEGPCRIFVKGASEIILKLCTQQAELDGSLVPFDEKCSEKVQADAVNKFASASMRTISVAYRDFPSPPNFDEEVDPTEAAKLTGLVAKCFTAETELIFLGVFGIHDPIRDGVPSAIAKCNSAGVDVRMCTGDHRATAIAIAKDCGILRKHIDYQDSPSAPLVHRYSVMTGDEFRNIVLKNGAIDQLAFDEVWPYLRVLARSSPEDKHTLVTGLCESELFASERGEHMTMIFPDRQIVAVTGDGTNDAPALRRADVGFAMKITGTRVAQDAADILLLDDNFESVVKACMWGRNVYDSIAKFLQFQLTVNISAVAISLIGAISIQKAPLSVVQMLWVNLIMDSLGALALAAEPPSESLLERAPYGRNKGLLSYEMLCNMIGQSIYQLIVLLTLLFNGGGLPPPGDVDPETWVFEKGGIFNIETGIGQPKSAGPTVHYTIVFNAFVFMQMFNWINCRMLYHEFNVFANLHRNPLFVGIWIVCALVQVLLVQAGAFFSESGENLPLRTTALTLSQWQTCLMLGVGSMLWYFVVCIFGRMMKSTLSREEAWQPTTEMMQTANSFSDEYATVLIPGDPKKKKDKDNDVEEDEAAKSLAASPPRRPSARAADKTFMQEYSTEDSQRVCEKTGAPSLAEVQLSSKNERAPA